MTLRDGEDVHYCALGLEDDEYIGRCDCKGWQYHDVPCAYLCALRKADFLELISVESTDGSPDDGHEMCHATGETHEGEPHDAAIDRTRQHSELIQVGRTSGGVVLPKSELRALGLVDDEDIETTILEIFRTTLPPVVLHAYSASRDRIHTIRFLKP
ncbi:hypothetical protein [Natrinema marinum]|uniref:hypothetical protein n=1 Tax=Natrinema marinum TaxID=2961598 RepID=UPI0020C8A820|nr:hypothetical protein [Natrinema marinum]